MRLTAYADALGWTLLHSLWEGAAVALMLATALTVLQSARFRYIAGCMAMLGMLAAFLITMVIERPGKSIPFGIVVVPPSKLGGGQSLSALATRFQTSDLPPYLAALWIVGVALFHLRSIAGWMEARRFSRQGVCVAPAAWQLRLAELRAALRLRETVTLLESCLAPVPVVIGYLRPVILVPIGMLTSMPPGQVEAILLHELAHIRRRDYLVNLLQTAVENFLFYHPAVWWISSVIRSEREHCCDDLVVATNGAAGEYAMALTVLENNRWTAQESVLASSGGNLMKRITRILFPLDHRQAVLAPVVLAGILTLIASVALSAWQAKPLEIPTGAYGKWLTEDVAYLIDARERAAFQALGTDAEREHFIEQFWLRRDPSEGTARNEFKEEHYRRIAYANEKYSTPVDAVGWQTDRGRIYISWGPPDEIESHPSGGAETAPYEDWLYYKIDGIGERVLVRFVDKTGNGDYRSIGAIKLR